jgi:hypothetical protein
MTAALSLHRLNNNNGCLLAGRRQSEGKHFSAYDTLRPVPHPMYLHMQRNAADQQAMWTRHFARHGELLDTYHVASYSVELAWLSAYLYYRFRFWLRRGGSTDSRMCCGRMLSSRANAKQGVTPRRLRLARSDGGKLRVSLLEQVPAPLTPDRNNARADKEGGTSIPPLRTPNLVARRQTYG